MNPSGSDAVGLLAKAYAGRARDTRSQVKPLGFRTARSAMNFECSRLLAVADRTEVVAVPRASQRLRSLPASRAGPIPSPR